MSKNKNVYLKSDVVGPAYEEKIKTFLKLKQAHLIPEIKLNFLGSTDNHLSDVIDNKLHSLHINIEENILKV